MNARIDYQSFLVLLLSAPSFALAQCSAPECLLGQMAYRPGILGKTSTVIFKFLNEDKEVDEQERDLVAPAYRFQIRARAFFDAVKIKISEPKNYVVIGERFLRSRKDDSVALGQVQAKRSQDALIELLNSTRTLPAAAAVPRLEFAKNAKWAETYGQEVELTRRLANARFRLGEYLSGEQVLASLYVRDEFSTLGPKKQQVYWQERFDSFLLHTKYDSLRLPEKDFPIALTSGEAANALTQWKAFVSDYSKQYPETLSDVVDRTDPQSISDQLRVIREHVRSIK